MTTASYSSVAAMFADRVRRAPESTAYMYPRPDDTWVSLTWRQTGERVRRIACGLQALGVKPENRCGIQSSTRIEWVLADLGIMCAAGATTTIYPSNVAEECAYILADSQSRVVFAEDQAQVAKLLQHRNELPDVHRVVTFDGASGHDGWVMTLGELEQLGAQYDAEHPGHYDETLKAITPDMLATLVYTSGTTGRPKGVELPHDCWVFEGEAIASLGIVTPNDVQYLWLPLSHVLGKVLQVAQLQVGFPTAVDGRIPKLVDNLALIRPTFMGAAPRIFEKVYNKVQTGAAEAGGLKLRIFSWAESVGRRASRLRLQGKSLDPALALQARLADKLVFSKLRARFGGRVRFFISGAAPLSAEIAEFFHAAGILILEGYGLTESSAASFVNRPDAFRFGSVGLPIGGTEVRLADEDKEILIRSRGVMRGYHNLPEQTAEALTADGWLRTGDIGDIDANGFLRITDRKKDLIKTSGGKYIAPQLLEGRLKALCPYIGHVVVHGDRRSYCTALVTLDGETVMTWAADHGISGTFADVTRDERARAMVQEAVDKLNGQLASYETIKRFALLPKELTVEDGELTASLKVKRKVVEQKYREVLDGLYA